MPLPSRDARPVYGRPAHLATSQRGHLHLTSLVDVPPAVTWTTPNGHVLTRRPRGVYWEDYVDGCCFIVVGVDSTGDCRGLVRRVPLNATAAEADAAEDELLALLDHADPVVRQRAG